MLTFHNSTHLTFNGFSFVCKTMKIKSLSIYLLCFLVVVCFSFFFSLLSKTHLEICLHEFTIQPICLTRFGVFANFILNSASKVLNSLQKCFGLLKINTVNDVKLRRTNNIMSIPVSIQVKTGNSIQLVRGSQFGSVIQLNHLK